MQDKRGGKRRKAADGGSISGSEREDEEAEAEGEESREEEEEEEEEEEDGSRDAPSPSIVNIPQVQLVGGHAVQCVGGVYTSQQAQQCGAVPLPVRRRCQG